MTNYEKLMQIMPKGTLAHLLVEKGTYDDGDYVFDGEDEHWDSWEVEYFRFLDKYYETEEEAYKDALRWLNKEVNESSLDDIADILGFPDTEDIDIDISQEYAIMAKECCGFVE